MNKLDEIRERIARAGTRSRRAGHGPADRRELLRIIDAAAKVLDSAHKHRIVPDDCTVCRALRILRGE